MVQAFKGGIFLGVGVCKPFEKVFLGRNSNERQRFSLLLVAQAQTSLDAVPIKHNTMTSFLLVQ